MLVEKIWPFLFGGTCARYPYPYAYVICLVEAGVLTSVVVVVAIVVVFFFFLLNETEDLFIYFHTRRAHFKRKEMIKPVFSIIQKVKKGQS